MKRSILMLIVVLAGMVLVDSVHADPLLPWRAQIHRRLQNMESKPAPQQAAPPLQILLIPGEPKQVLPIQGDPKQQLPIQGDPKQPLPVPGPPKQDLPPSGPPRQDLPIQGPGQPPQQVPITPPGGPQPLTVYYVRCLYR